MGAVGIYNEIPDEIDGKDNADHEPAQIPNRQAVDVIEASNLNYTILRPGYLQDGDENDFVLTVKGEAAKGFITTIASVVKLAIRLIQDEKLCASLFGAVQITAMVGCLQGAKCYRDIARAEC